MPSESISNTRRPNGDGNSTGLEYVRSRWIVLAVDCMVALRSFESYPKLLWIDASVKAYLLDHRCWYARYFIFRHGPGRFAWNFAEIRPETNRHTGIQ